MCRSEEGLPRDQGRQGLLEIFQLRGRLAGLKSESGRGAQMLCHKNNKWTGARRGALLLRAMPPRPVLQVAVDSGQGHKILPVALQAQLSHHSRPLPIGYFCYGMCQPLGFSWGTRVHVTPSVHSAPPSVRWCIWGWPGSSGWNYCGQCLLSAHFYTRVSMCTISHLAEKLGHLYAARR